jgi:hypothetical protein
MTTATHVRDRSLIFSADSVRAILDGRKTQTRRVITPQPAHVQRHEWRGRVLYDAEHRLWWWKEHSFENLIDFTDERRRLARLSPFGSPGDHLWVREVWMPVDLSYRAPASYAVKRDRAGKKHAVIYRADSDAHVDWNSPIHMPRWASRITLEIVGVRVERVQDITPEDCQQEGVTVPRCDCECCSHSSKVCTADQSAYLEAFRELWDSINGKKHPWASNPFVWVISFRKLNAASAAKGGQS